MDNEYETVQDGDEIRPVTRRYFLESVGGTAIVVSGAGTGALFVEYLKPNVLYEPPTAFRAGVPDDYPVGVVATKKEHQTYIVREADGFYAMSTICTHLGCMTRWENEEGIIFCPCHGSKFTRTGDIIEGPAPRPLPRFEIRLEEGELVVDTAKVVDRDGILKA